MTDAYHDGFTSGFEMPDDQWAGFEVYLYAITLPDSLTPEEKEEAFLHFVQGVCDGFYVQHERWPRFLFGERGVGFRRQ